MRHEMYNADTAARIRRTLRNRFENGGVVQFVTFGYVKPPGAKHDSEMFKDPAAAPIIEEIVRRLEDGASYAEVADWLNDQGVKPGPYCDLKRWTGHMVSDFMHNAILKGVRQRNRMISRRLNQTGRHRSVKAPPSELLQRNCPHLAFIESARYDRLIRRLDERNARYRKKSAAGSVSTAGSVTKRTIWPGQHISCGICGRPYRYGGHGQTDHLMCRGAWEYTCWNGVTVDGPLGAMKMIDTIRKEIVSLPDFDPVFLELVREHLNNGQAKKASAIRDAERRIEKNTRERQHVLAAIRAAGHSPSLLEELQNLDTEGYRLSSEKDRLVELPDSAVDIPTMEVIRELATNAFREVAFDSPGFGRLVRRVVPRGIVVFPFRLCDGGRVVLRARFTLQLDNLLPECGNSELLSQNLQRSLEVDLFDPPQREAYRTRIVKMVEHEKLDQRETAFKLGIKQQTVHRSLVLHRTMIRLGLSDPYVPVLAPPEDRPKLKRHKHPRYRFLPLQPPQEFQPPLAG
jgi:hypothetical protein